MQVARLTTFVATRKEPLAELLERIHGAFRALPSSYRSRI
jgi:hypothetical protein